MNTDQPLYALKSTKQLQDGWLVVNYQDDRVLFRKWKTVPVHVEALKLTELGHEIRWHNRNVVLRVTKEQAQIHKPSPIPFSRDTDTLYHHVPIIKYTRHEGDPNWFEQLSSDYSWEPKTETITGSERPTTKEMPHGTNHT